RRDVYAEHALARQTGDQLRVQAVNALDDDELVRRQLHQPPLQALALNEVETRQAHFFAANQLRKMFVEQRHIDRLQRLESQRAVFVARRELTVDKVVIHLQRERTQTVRQKLDRQTLGEGRFTGRRWPGNHDNARALCLVSPANLVGNTGNALFVQRLRHQQQFLNGIAPD